MDTRIEIDTVLPHTPERVWRALTEPERLAEWLLPSDFEPRIGFRFTFRPVRGRRSTIKSPVRCQVIELEPMRRLAYSWAERPDDLPDLITWTLEPVAEGTRLRLEHSHPVEHDATSISAALATPMLWCGSAIRLERLLSRGLTMGRAVPARGRRLTYAVTIVRHALPVSPAVGGVK